jgi:hypothetical protein
MKGGLNMSKVIKIIIGVILGFWLIGLIISIGSHKSIAKKLDENDQFEYSTSMTSNYDRSDKAKVYSTKMGVKDTAMYLIDQERPIEHTDLDNDEAIQLTYDDQYILIYESEDGETLVQISSRKYIHNNGYNGLYRPYRNNIMLFYHTSYLGSRYYRRDSNRYGQGYTTYRDYNTSSTMEKTSTSKTESKPTNNTSKIKTDKNASSKIRTNSSKTSTSGNTTNNTTSNNTTSNNTNSKTSSSKTSASRTTSSTSSSKKTGFFGKTKSIRSSSVGSRSSLGGGTSFGK